MNSLLLLPLGVYCWTESFTQLASVSLEHKKIMFQKRNKKVARCLFVPEKFSDFYLVYKDTYFLLSACDALI